MDIPSDTLAASETMESKIEKCMDIGSAFERPFWTDKSTVPYDMDHNQPCVHSL